MSSILDSTRRGMMLALASVPLAACSSTDSTEYSAITDAVKVELGLKAAPTITLREAAGVPYSSLGFSIGDGRETMLVLASATGDNLLWTASNRVSLLTVGGRIVRTAGFPWNLSGTEFLDSDPVSVGLQKGLPGGPIRRFLDFHDVSRYSVPVIGTFKSRKTDTITILEQSLQVIAVVEACKCDSIGWEFENTFWADPDTGFIWKSVQNVHPNLDPLTVEILRPPA